MVGTPVATRAGARCFATFLLPYPPSVNRIYRIFKNRLIKSAEYRAWLDEAHKALLLQDTERHGWTSPVRVEAAVGRPDNRKRDLDNVFKATADFCEAAGFVENDHLIHAWNVYWSRDVTNGVLVTIIPMPAEAA